MPRRSSSGACTAPAHADAAAFTLRPEGGSARGVLLIHGFTGTPFELRPAGADLCRRGYLVHAPLLHGHGQGPVALGRSTAAHWIESARAGLLALAREVPRVAVLGLSMGGLLAIELARAEPALVRALVLLAVPLWLRPIHAGAIRAFSARRRTRGLILPKLFGSDVRDRKMRRINPATSGMPVEVLTELLGLMQRVRRHLADVAVPALLAHGVEDHTVPYACMNALAKGLGTPRAHLRLLSMPQSYHLLPLDVEREMLFDVVAAHLGRYL